MEAVLGCQLGEATEDDRVGLVRGQCAGTCEQSPQVWVDGRVVGKLTAAKAVTLARGLRDGRAADDVISEIEAS